MIDLRCPVCGRLLMKGQIVEVQVKCPKCKKLVKLSCNKE